MVSFFLAILCAAAACWLAVFQAGRWQRRRLVLARLRQRGLSWEDGPRNDVPEGLVSRLTTSPLMQSDYKEAFDALRLTGREAERIQTIYLLVCWSLPLMLVVLGAMVAGFFGAMFLGAISFIGSRRYIRGMGRKACYQQNLEAIDFAQMLSMLLEAGLTVERGFRVAALQARPLIPGLAYRLDRFNRLMESGADRSAALDDIGEGKDIPVLHGLTRLLKQSGALGGAITESIQQLIDEALDVEKSQIKEKVNKVGAKMTVVMMIFMMPALFIIVGGPAGINIVEALAR
ncbi:type II secretion system F family protein [Alcanivorax sp.]|uniref:type II secretion system F family protein n=1 Tax=Alcanivorax sp. TaxID=1872427 RepID=UPI0032D95236